MLLHQMWLDSDPSKARVRKPPAKTGYSKYISGIKKLHPDWTYHWWNVERVEKELWTHPRLERYRATYNKLPLLIMKCDMARYALLWLYGGVYLDLDTKLHKPIPKEWVSSLHLFQEPPYQSGGRRPQLYQETGFSSIISNQPLICPAKHPFMLELLDEVVSRATKLRQLKRDFPAKWHALTTLATVDTVIKTTGPEMLTDMAIAGNWLGSVRSPCHFFGTDRSGKAMKCDRWHSSAPECDQAGYFCSKEEVKEAIGSNTWDEGTGWYTQERGWWFWCRVVMAVILLIAIYGILAYFLVYEGRSKVGYIGCLVLYLGIILGLGALLCLWWFWRTEDSDGMKFCSRK